MLFLSKQFAIIFTGDSDRLLIAANLVQEKDERQDSNYTCENKLRWTVDLRAAKQTSIKHYSSWTILFSSTRLVFM